MAKGDEIPRPDHVVRYVPGREVLNGMVNGSAFLRRLNEGTPPSTNWLEYFAGGIRAQLNEVRLRKRLNYAANGYLACVNVGRALDKVAAVVFDINVSFLHDPLPPDPPRHPLDDPSHSVIDEVPTVDTPEGEFIGDAIALAVVQVYRARA